MNQDQDTFLLIAKTLLTQPAAPYHELGMTGIVKELCKRFKIPLKSTPCGNLIATIKRGRSGRPMVMAAHMDHPGFSIQARVSTKQWKAEFLGGVPDKYFKKGTRLRLQPGNHPATLGDRLHGKKRVFHIDSRTQPKARPEFAVWDLKPFAQKKNHIHGRACDDLIGLAAALTTLVKLKKGRKPVHAIALITRAEEVGFHGALMETIEKRLPKDPLILSLETSSEMPPVKQGAGVIVRVGDRSSVFDSLTTRFLCNTAEALKKKNPDFHYQRALMQGGSCEGTAFQEFGYQTGALCVALGNYHNCGPNNLIAEEYIHTLDAFGMVELLTKAANEFPQFKEITGKTTVRIEELRKAAIKAFQTR
ncbi:hypothetical protein N9B94_03675 [Verrucomicrobia bacterium]|nr:hypothetical protein [Verrucomicrobiota bacterium]MDB4458954.1 hypothetical protein [bacterium]